MCLQSTSEPQLGTEVLHWLVKAWLSKIFIFRGFFPFSEKETFLTWEMNLLGGKTNITKPSIFDFSAHLTHRRVMLVIHMCAD